MPKATQTPSTAALLCLAPGGSPASDSSGQSHHIAGDRGRFAAGEVWMCDGVVSFPLEQPRGCWLKCPAALCTACASQHHPVGDEGWPRVGLCHCSHLPSCECFMGDTQCPSKVLSTSHGVLASSRLQPLIARGFLSLFQCLAAGFLHAGSTCSALRWSS